MFRSVKGQTHRQQAIARHPYAVRTVSPWVERALATSHTTTTSAAIVRFPQERAS